MTLCIVLKNKITDFLTRNVLDTVQSLLTELSRNLTWNRTIVMSLTTKLDLPKWTLSVSNYINKNVWKGYGRWIIRNALVSKLEMSGVFTFNRSRLLVASTDCLGAQTRDELFNQHICVHCVGVVWCSIRLHRSIEADIVGVDDQIVQTGRICRWLWGTPVENPETHSNGRYCGAKHCGIYVSIPFLVWKKNIKTLKIFILT